MGEKYYAIKEGKPLHFLDINAIFSSIYTPCTPALSTNKDDITRHYHKKDDDFVVFDDKNGALLEGNISSVLVRRLQDYGVRLTKI